MVELVTELPVGVGQELAEMRGELNATQSQVAAVAGIDQSRVSRIEKGEPATSAEIGKVLDALSTLGSRAAQDYRAYLTKTWNFVPRPDFSNPQRNVLEFAEEALRQIDTFVNAGERPWPLRRQLERQKAAIESTASYLCKVTHQLAFIGEVGVGKSTAISFLYGLLDTSASASDLRDRVVLETGGGHTTLCEVNIRRGPGFGIIVQPQSEEEMRNLVADFCAATWMRRPDSNAAKNEAVNVSEEVLRALRNMSGLTVRRERDAQGRTSSRDQAFELAQQCADETEFRTRVLERLKPELRSRREIWIDEPNSRLAMPQMRKLFREINNGRIADVPLPASIDLVIPNFGSELAGLTVSAVDTKGLDEIVVRADLDARLKDARTHVILCSTFNQAPSTSVQLLLDHLRNAHSVRLDVGKVSVLALPRDEEAMALKDDSGEAPIDDEDGYNLKREQIIRTLASGAGAFTGVPISFFNAKKDDPEKVRTQLLDQVLRLRKAYEDRLLEECAAADEVVHNHEKQAFTAAVQAVADRLGHFLSAHATLPPRVRQPAKEVKEAMEAIRYASTVWAMTRRNGEYAKFSISHHVGAGAARDALLRSRDWFEKLQGVLDTLKQDPDLKLAERTLKQVEDGVGGWRKVFAEAARTAATEVYRDRLASDGALWSRCSSQWGAGPGFKVHVGRIVEKWFEEHVELNQRLETLTAALWDQCVLKPLERLSVESAQEMPEQESSDNIIPFARAASV